MTLSIDDLFRMPSEAELFLAERLLPLAAWPSFTADLVIRPGAGRLEVLLLETNPPVSSGRVFPGLFDDGALDGGFRLL